MVGLQMNTTLIFFKVWFALLFLGRYRWNYLHNVPERINWLISRQWDLLDFAVRLIRLGRAGLRTGSLLANRWSGSWLLLRYRSPCLCLCWYLTRSRNPHLSKIWKRHCTWSWSKLLGCWNLMEARVHFKHFQQAGTHVFCAAVHGQMQHNKTLACIDFRTDIPGRGTLAVILVPYWSNPRADLLKPAERYGWRSRPKSWKQKRSQVMYKTELSY